MYNCYIFLFYRYYYSYSYINLIIEIHINEIHTSTFIYPTHNLLDAVDGYMRLTNVIGVEYGYIYASDEFFRRLLLTQAIIISCDGFIICFFM